MQAAEVLTRVIAMSDELLSLHPSQRPENADVDKESHPDYVAVAVCQAMLNTAIPVARFRAHVSIEGVTGNTKLGLSEFTVSAVNIDGIKSGLVGLSMEGLAVYASLWEQRATGADMLSGYQGNTKTKGFREWLKQIDQFEVAPVIQ